MQMFTNVIIEIEKYVQHSLCNDRETNVCVLERGEKVRYQSWAACETKQSWMEG